MEFFRQEYWSRVSISSSRWSSRPRDQTCLNCFPCIGRRILYHWATWVSPHYNVINTYTTLSFYFFHFTHKENEAWGIDLFKVIHLISVTQIWTQDPEFTFLTINRRNKISDMLLIPNNNRQSYTVKSCIFVSYLLLFKVFLLVFDHLIFIEVLWVKRSIIISFHCHPWALGSLRC